MPCAELRAGSSPAPLALRAPSADPEIEGFVLDISHSLYRKSVSNEIVLRESACEDHLTCVELDMALALSLTRRPTSRNIRVVQAETLHLPFAESAFSAVLCFNVLRRLPSLAHQDRLMAEVARVLRGAGTFAGTDSYAGFLFRTIHIRDTFTPIDPRTLKQRLLATRFEAASVENGAREFRFRAWRSFSGGAVPF